MSITLNAEQITANRHSLATAEVGGKNPAAVAAANAILQEFANEMGMGVQRTAVMFARQHETMKISFADSHQGEKNAIAFDADAANRLLNAQSTRNV